MFWILNKLFLTTKMCLTAQITLIDPTSALIKKAELSYSKIKGPNTDYFERLISDSPFNKFCKSQNGILINH